MEIGAYAGYFPGGNTLPAQSAPASPHAPAARTAPALPGRVPVPPTEAGSGPSAQRAEEDGARRGGRLGARDSYECRTCKNRTYQDGSNDPGVSFKTPAKIAAGAVYSTVRGHEMEHVSHEQAKARREDREVVSQTVMLHNAICPECGRVYIAGGTTRTVTKSGADLAALYRAGESAPREGQNVDATA